MAISRRRGGGATPRDLAGGRGNFGLRLPPSGRLRLPAAPALRRFCAYSAACAWGGSPAAASLRLPSPRYARPCGDPRPATGKGRGTRAKKKRGVRAAAVFGIAAVADCSLREPPCGGRVAVAKPRVAVAVGVMGASGQPTASLTLCPAAQKRYRQPCKRAKKE